MKFKYKVRKFPPEMSAFVKGYLWLDTETNDLLIDLGSPDENMAQELCQVLPEVMQLTGKLILEAQLTRTILCTLKFYGPDKKPREVSMQLWQPLTLPDQQKLDAITNRKSLHVPMRSQKKFTRYEMESLLKRTHSLEVAWGEWIIRVEQASFGHRGFWIREKASTASNAFGENISPTASQNVGATDAFDKGTPIAPDANAPESSDPSIESNGMSHEDKLEPENMPHETVAKE